MRSWNIGDRVKVLDLNAVPAERRAKATNGDPNLWSGSKAKLAGTVGVVVDKLYSGAFDCYVYKLKLEGYDKTSASLFIGDDLEPVASKEYRWDVSIADTVVVVRFFDGDKQLGVGHGHIFHDGDIGVMQAASYAAKKLYEQMGGFKKEDM